MSHELVNPVADQFFCELHQYGWSVNGDGANLGCVYCLARVDFIQQLRNLATFLEENESAPCPHNLSAMVSINDRANFLKAAKSIGFAAKEFNDEYLSLKKLFGPITYEIFTARKEFCERKVVGKRVVPERTEDIVEWECSESLFKSEGEAEQDRQRELAQLRCMEIGEER